MLGDLKYSSAAAGSYSDLLITLKHFNLTHFIWYLAQDYAYLYVVWLELTTCEVSTAPLTSSYLMIEFIIRQLIST